MPERLKSSATRNSTPSKTRLLGHFQWSRRAQKRGEHARKRLSRFAGKIGLDGATHSPVPTKCGWHLSSQHLSSQDWMGPPTLRYQRNATKYGWHLSSSDGAFRPPKEMWMAPFVPQSRARIWPQQHMPEWLKSSATRNSTPSKTRLLGHFQRSRRAQKRGEHAC
jgi:hypothetical protein